MATFDFYDTNDHALQDTHIVLRDSLGALAVQILASRHDLSEMDYSDMLDELQTIISDLHQAYGRG